MNREKIIKTVLAAVKLSAAYQKTSKKRQEELESLLRDGINVHFIEEMSKDASVDFIADGSVLDINKIAFDTQKAQNKLASDLHFKYTRLFGEELMNELSIDVPKNEIELKGAKEAVEQYKRMMGTDVLPNFEFRHIVDEKIEDLHDTIMAELAKHNIEKHDEEVLDYDKLFDKEEE